MALREDLERLGNFLFRWRSYIPLVMIIPFILAMKEFQYPDDNHIFDMVWELCCFFISLLGLAVRIKVVAHTPKGTSGRNTKEQVADYLNTTGMYSIWRHPLYMGNFLIWLGIVMSIRVPWFILISILFFWAYYLRIIFAEEEFLRKKYGDSFLNWANKTPIFIPKLRNWTKPALPFSIKTAIKGEYSSLFAIIASFMLIELIGDFIVNKKLVIDHLWGFIFTFGLILYLIIRYIRKNTGLLKNR